MADFDELKLTVTLTDNASAGLANIRAQLTGIVQTAGQVQTAFAGVSSSVTQVGQAAQRTVPHVSSQEKALKDLTHSAEETTRGLLQMGLAARRGAEAFPELAIATREAWTGIRGASVAMGEMGAASQTMVVALGGVVLGVAAIGAAVVAYGISVFKFSQEMYQLSQTAKTLGVTFGSLRSLTEQNERFGTSVDATIGQIGRLQEALTDLSENNSQLRQQLIGKGLDPNWLNQYTRETDLVTQQNMARERGLAIRDAEIARGKTMMQATGEMNRFLRSVGQDPAIATRGPARHATKEEEEQAARIAKQSELIAEQWREISKIVGDLKTEFLAWGLPGVLEVVTGIRDAFTKIGQEVESIRKFFETVDSWTPQWLKNVFRGMANGPGGAADNAFSNALRGMANGPNGPPGSPAARAPNYNPRSGYRPPPEAEGPPAPPAAAAPESPSTNWWSSPNRSARSGYHPTSFGGANDNNPLLHNASFGGDGGGGGGAQAIIKGGVFEALVEFYGYLQGGGAGRGGGAGGIVNAAYSPGGGGVGAPGGAAAPGGATGVASSFGNAQFPNLGGGPNAAANAGIPSSYGDRGGNRPGGGGSSGTRPAETSSEAVSTAQGAPADAGRPASGKRAERIAAAKTAMEDQLRKEGVPEANIKEATNQLAGQALAESDLNPGLSHDQGTGHGIYGARNERRAGMNKWLAEQGYDNNSLEGQSRYMAHEAMTGKDYGKTRAALMGATPENRAATTEAVTRNFERPARINNRVGQVSEAANVAAAAPSTAAGAPGQPGSKVASLDPNQVFGTAQVDVPGAKVATGGQTAKGVPAHLSDEVKAMTMAGAQPHNIQAYLKEKGVDLSVATCGQFMSAVVKERGGTPPKGAAIASNWNTFGGKEGAGYSDDPNAINVAVKQGTPTGLSGSHVTDAVAVKDEDGKIIGFRGVGVNQGKQGVPGVGQYGRDVITSNKIEIGDRPGQYHIRHQIIQGDNDNAVATSNSDRAKVGGYPSSMLDRGGGRAPIGLGLNDNLDRPALDRAALSKPTEINSRGNLDVNVSAPAGTKVNYHGQNLLKNTSMQRQTQMMPSQGGPSVSDTANSYLRGGAA